MLVYSLASAGPASWGTPRVPVTLGFVMGTPCLLKLRPTSPIPSPATTLKWQKLPVTGEPGWMGTRLHNPL